MLIDKLLTSSFTLINSYDRTNKFLKVLDEFSNKDYSNYQHYVILYQDINELRDFQYLSLTSRHETLFLCKYNDEKIIEIEPFYQINHEVCFNCLANNMTKYRVIHQEEAFQDDEELQKSEYLYSIVDYFLHNKTWLSSIQERRITINDDLVNYSALIPPISPTCECIE